MAVAGHHVAFLVAFASLLSVPAWGQDDEQESDTVWCDDFYAAVRSRSGRIGLIDDVGHLVIDTIYFGIVPFGVDNPVAWGNTDPEVMKTWLEEETDQGYYNEGILGAWRMIGIDGRPLNDRTFREVLMFTDGLAIGHDMKGRTLLVHVDGRVVADTVYTRILHDEGGAIYRLEQGDRISVYDPATQRIVQMPAGRISNFFGDHAVLQRDGKQALVDRTGRIVTPFAISIADLDMDLDTLIHVEGQRISERYGVALTDSTGQPISWGGRTKRIVLGRIIQQFTTLYMDTSSTTTTGLPGMGYTGPYYFPREVVLETYGCNEGYYLYLAILDHTELSFTLRITKDYYYSCTRGAGTSREEPHSINYRFANGTSIPVALKDVLVHSPECSLVLNTELERDHPGSVVQFGLPWDEVELPHDVGWRWSIGVKGLCFTLAEPDYFVPSNPAPIVIPWKMLKPHLKKEWRSLARQ